MSEDKTKKKRKREVAPEARITYHTAMKSFERLFNESTLEETKRVVRRKLGLPDSAPINLAQKRGNTTIVLEDEDDFEAFRVALETTSLVELQVMVPNQELQDPAPKKRKVKPSAQNNTTRESVVSDQAESLLNSSISNVFPPPSDSLSSVHRGGSTSIASPESSPAPAMPMPTMTTPPPQKPAKGKRKSTKGPHVPPILSPTAKAKAEVLLQQYEEAQANKPPRVRKKKEQKEITVNKEKGDSTTIPSVQVPPTAMAKPLQSPKVESSASPSLAPAAVPSSELVTRPSKPTNNTKLDAIITKPSAAKILNKPKVTSTKQSHDGGKSNPSDSNTASISAQMDTSRTEALCPICSKPFHLRFKCPLVRSGGSGLEKRLEQLKSDGNHELVNDIENYLANEQKREQLSMANRMNHPLVSKSTSKKAQDKQHKVVLPAHLSEGTATGSRSHVTVQKPGEGSENSSNDSSDVEKLVDDDDMSIWDELEQDNSVPQSLLGSPPPSLSSLTRKIAGLGHTASKDTIKPPSNTVKNSYTSNKSSKALQQTKTNNTNKKKASDPPQVIVENSSDSEQTSSDEESNSQPSDNTSMMESNHLSLNKLNDKNLARTPDQKQNNALRHGNTAPIMRTSKNDMQRSNSSPSAPKAQSLSQPSHSYWFSKAVPSLSNFQISYLSRPKPLTTPSQSQTTDPKKDLKLTSLNSESSTSSGSDDESDRQKIPKGQQASSSRPKDPNESVFSQF